MANELEGLGDFLARLSGSKEVEKTPYEKAVAELEALEGRIVSDENEYEMLLAEKRRINEMLMGVTEKIREIEERRFQKRRLIREAKAKVEQENLREQEALRARKLEEERAQTFENIKARIKELNPAWLPYLMEHQWEAAMKVALNGSTIIADGMGLGKTLEAIASADTSDAKKVIVFAPNDVCQNFVDEFRLWAPHRNLIPLKSASKQLKAFVTPIIETADEFTLVMNYETLWGRGEYNKRFMRAIKDAKIDLMIIDEAHVIKDEEGRSFELMADLRQTIKNVVPLTGTPILNSPEDLFTMLNLLDPNRFYAKNVYLGTYCTQDYDTGKWVFKSGGVKSLITQLGGRIIKRSFHDVGIELPTQHIREVVIPWETVSMQQRIVMEQIKQHAQLIMEKTDDNGEPIQMSITAMIALITRQRQAAVWPGGIEFKEWDYDEEGKRIPGTDRVVYRVSEEVTDSIKLEIAVARLAQAKEAGKRSVVFSQFKEALKELESRLRNAGLNVARFDGDTPDPVRQKIKKDFLRPKDGSHLKEYTYDVVLANFKTGGVGLTFTEATYMLLLDEEWNPGKNEQAYARIHRIGQTEETYVDILRLEEPSIDMWMKTLNEQKKAIADGLANEIDVQAELNKFMFAGSLK